MALTRGMIVKIEMSFLAGLLLQGNDLLARMTILGVEPALISLAVEYGAAGLRAVKRVTRLFIPRPCCG